MRPTLRPLAALTAFAALCGCGGHSGSSQPAAAPAGGSSSAAASSTASASASTGPASPAASRPGPAVTGTSTASPIATSPSVRSGGTTPTSAAAVFPSPGHYTYDVSGTATTPLGTQDLAGTSDLTVDPVDAGRQHSAEKDANGSTEQTVYARASGVYLADLHIAQQGFDEDFRPVAAALVVPSSPRRGQQWAWQMHSTDGRYSLAATLTVDDPRSSATVGGHRLQTVVVSGHIVITGSALRMTIDQRDVVARATPVVSEHAVVDGTAYGAKFHSDSTRRLRSTTPH